MNITAYIAIEESLSARLQSSWAKESAKIYAKIEAALEKEDYATATDLAYKLDLTGVGLNNQQYIMSSLMAAANFGARMASGGGVAMSLGEPDPLLDHVTQNFCTSLEHNATLQAQTSILQLIAKVQAGEVALKADAPRKVKEFVTFKESGDAMLQLISSLHTSRLAVWGFTGEANLLGFTEYKITAVLDGRTSDFCRMLNGHTFKVADARKTAIEVLMIEKPDDAKTLQPWPKQSAAAIEEYSAMSSAELTALNLHIPPYHPNCRTFLVRADKQPRESAPPTPEIAGIPKGVYTPESFAEIGAKFSPENVQHWNAYMGVSPAALLANLAGSPTVTSSILEDYIKHKLQKLWVSPNGSFRMNTSNLIPTPHHLGHRIAYDPYSGEMTVLTSPIDAYGVASTRKLATLGAKLGIMSDAVGVAQTTIEIPGKAGAFSAITEGLLPTAKSWGKARTKILQSIAKGEYPSLQLLPLKDYTAVLKMLQDPDPKILQSIAKLGTRLPGKTSLGKYLLEDLRMQYDVPYAVPPLT